MRSTHLFPSILVVLDIGAAFVHLYYGHYVKMVYWFAAAILTGCIIFMEDK